MFLQVGSSGKPNGLTRVKILEATGARDLCEPTLHLIDPGIAVGAQLQHVMWASSKPDTHPRSFVSGRCSKTI
jgi:hypothetical protein